MDFAALTPFVLFVAVMTGTPGPGNLTFMAIGASAGYRTAFPVIMAAEIGSIFLNLCVAYGLGQIMAGGGPLVMAFKVLSLTYMAYLAWRIVSLNIRPKGEVSLPSFWEGLLIHPLSPKTWAMSLVAYASFFAGNGLGLTDNALLLTGGFALGGLIAHSIWALIGVSILAFLGDGPALRTATILMALAMLASTLWAMLL